MAPFNPVVQPINAPNYGSQSRAIELDQGIKPQGVAENQIMPQGVKQGDTSALYAGEAEAAGAKGDAIGSSAYANLFKDIASTADFLGKAGVTMVKKDIEDKVYAVADRERQSYTDALEKIKNGQGVTNVLDANAQMGEDGEGESNVPGAVEALPDTLSALQGAKDAGKISSSYYESRLLAEAKSLRAQYPGFRAEIDQEFAKVTGSNPANAYIHALVQDINRASTAQGSQQKQTLSYIRSHDKFPGSAEAEEKYMSGQWTAQDVFRWGSRYAQQDHQLQLNNLKHQDSANNRDDAQRVAGQNVDYSAGVAVNRYVDATLTKMGLNSDQDVDRLNNMQNSGSISPKEWQAWGQKIANDKMTITAKITADADAQGLTKSVGGKAELNKKIAEATKPLDMLLDRVYNKDFGGIYNVQHQIRADLDSAKQGIINDPKVGPVFQTMAAMKDLGGDQYVAKFNLDQIKGNFNQDFKEYFGRFSSEMGTQYNMRTSGVPYTFNSVIDHLKSQGVTDKKFNNAVFGEVQKITDPSVPDPIKHNYALAAFSPENRGMLSRLQQDGQTPIYQKWTSPEMTKEMHRLGKNDPKAWDNYTTWAKETFANELIPHELQDLGKIPADSNVKVGWDAVNHRFIPPPPPSQDGKTVATDYAYYNMAVKAVNRINSNMSNLKNITNVTGEDPDAFLLKAIADNAGKDVLQNVQGIPYQMIRSMGLGKLRQ